MKDNKTYQVRRPKSEAQILDEIARKEGYKNHAQKLTHLSALMAQGKIKLTTEMKGGADV